MIRGDKGFTLVELLVALALFSILSAGFYAVMFSQVNGSERTRAVVRVSEEARLGFNRMVRDTREGSLLGAGDVGFCPAADMEAGECYNVKVDFDGDGVYSNPNPSGDYESLTFAYNADEATIDLTVCDATGTAAGCITEVLVDRVEPVDPAQPIFEFSSNVLRYDDDNSGVTEWSELEAAALDDAAQLRLLSSVSFAFQIEAEDEGESTEFFSEAQLRNRRFGQF